MNQLPDITRRLKLILALLITFSCMAWFGPACQVAQAREPAVPKAVAPTSTQLKLTVPIMKLDDVRIGMKGYGLTVFHGTKIEPFPVEVISVQRDFAPHHGVVWIRCPGPRMQLSGPVHGMSGSPIYLWPLGEDHPVGQGGELIGAFAFGYQNVKDCYVGVQPIEYMIQAAGRLKEPAGKTPVPGGTSASKTSEDASQNAAEGGNPAGGTLQIRRLVAAARDQGGGNLLTWQATLLAQMLDPATSHALTPKWWLHDGLANGQSASPIILPARTSANPQDFSSPPRGLPGQGQPLRLLLPLTVGSPATARTMARVLEPMGLEPLAAANQTLAARPPVEIKPDQVKLEPGSVLAVPLAWGDADLSASGTVTALTTDGRVLGFGHAMFGDGATALPLATGYVHFVMPNTVSSFKLGGSLEFKGALLRDEQSAVVGSAKGTFTWAPVHVRISLPGQPVREYKYRVVHHQTLTPTLSAMVAMQSVTAAQNPPTINTLHMQATLRFSDQQVVNIDTMLPMSDPSAVASQIMPALTLMANNPYESRQVQSVDVSATYQTKVLTSTLARGTLNKSVLKPGQTADITLWVQPYGQDIQRKHVSIKVPTSLPDGDYQIVVGGAQSYMAMLLGTRPHLVQPTDMDSLFGLIKRVMEVDNTAMYVMLQTNQTALAVGQDELESLPSSRKALLIGSASTQTTEYPQWLDKKFNTDRVIEGQQAFVLHVRKSGELTQLTP